MGIRQGWFTGFLFVLFFTFSTDVYAAVTPEVPFCDENSIYLSFCSSIRLNLLLTTNSFVFRKLDRHFILF